MAGLSDALVWALSSLHARSRPSGASDMNSRYVIVPDDTLADWRATTPVLPKARTMRTK
jgi:hypothetical protein